MKHLLLTILLVACGGEPFTGESASLAAGGNGEMAGAAGDDTGAPVGGSASIAGSTSSAAGKTSGGSDSAPSTGGASGNATMGGSSATCDLDMAKLTALLPTTITWNDFTGTFAESCVTCRDKPCGAVKIISWGVPVRQGDEYIYYPNSNRPMMVLNFGANDGSCTKQVECGSQSGVTGLIVTAVRSGAGWKVETAMGTTGLGSNLCVEAATPYASGLLGQMGTDFSDEIGQQIKGLEFGCAE